MGTELQIILAILVAVGTGVVAMASDAFLSRRIAVFVTVLGLAGASAVSVWTSLEVQGGTPAFDVFIGGGGISAAVALMMALGAVTVFGGSRRLSIEPGGGSASALIAIASAASAGLAQSVDLIMTLIALETVAVCAYALIGASPGRRAAEAGMKYVIQGAVATGLALLGSAVLIGLYGSSGSFAQLGETIATAQLLPAAAGCALVVSAFAFKLGAAPFHSWAPDAFETARPSSSAFLSAVPKVGAVLGLFVALGVAFVRNVESLPTGLAAVAVLSIVVGNFGGLQQKSYTRMLGYSGVAQIGYAFTGLTVGVGLGDRVFFMLAPTLVLVGAYAIAAVGAFLAADALYEVRPSWDGSIAGLAGIGSERPFLGVAISACMFSLTGIPLTAGFWGKLHVFGGASSSGWAWLAVVAIVGSVVSFGYYGNVVRSLFFDSPMQASESPEGENAARRFSIATGTVMVIAVAVVALGIAPVLTGANSLLALFAG